jgi:hypothetical protein
MTAPRFERAPAAGPGRFSRRLLVDGKVCGCPADSGAALAWTRRRSSSAAHVEPCSARPPAEFLIPAPGSMAFPPRAFVAALEARGSASKRWTAGPPPAQGLRGEDRNIARP